MKVKLNYEELLVLDWISHFPVGSTDQDHLEWLEENFSLLQEDIWRNILALQEEQKQKKAEIERQQLVLRETTPSRQRMKTTTKGEEIEKEMELEIPEEKAQLLMTMVPTTFRWGTGEDAGFNLKLKLARALWGKRIEIEELFKEIGIKSESNQPKRRRRKGGESHAS